MMKLTLGTAMAVVLLAGCGVQDANQKQNVAAAVVATPSVDAAKLASVLAGPRREKDRARDGFRHTEQTIKFFDLAPDMNVAEVLPGGGWYTRVLLPYVSPDGGWYGVNYSVGLRGGIINYMGGDFNSEDASEYVKWPKEYPEAAAKNGPENAAIKGAFLFGEIPDDVKGQMDAVIFVRALHHLNRIKPEFFEQSVADTYSMLKPGGMVGVVQHRAKEDYSPNEYDVSGHKGYMKQSYVISVFEKGGFVLEEASEINANPKDTADYEGGVWTLLPSLRGKDKSMTEHYREIGESDRMTLRFRKPS